MKPEQAHRRLDVLEERFDMYLIESVADADKRVEAGAAFYRDWIGPLTRRNGIAFALAVYSATLSTAAILLALWSAIR